MFFEPDSGRVGKTFATPILRGQYLGGLLDWRADRLAELAAARLFAGATAGAFVARPAADVAADLDAVEEELIRGGVGLRINPTPAGLGGMDVGQRIQEDILNKAKQGKQDAEATAKSTGELVHILAGVPALLKQGLNNARAALLGP